MKPSLKNRILIYLRQRPYVFINGSEIEKLSMSLGMKASNGSRRARELAEEGRIERMQDKSVFYRYIPNKYEQFHMQQQSQPTQQKLI